MSKKEVFIAEVEKILVETKVELSDDAAIFFESLKLTSEKENKKFTENGIIILSYMREHKSEYKNMFKAKDIENSGKITSRAASASMQKLVKDGYLEKLGASSPAIYSLTELGENVELEA